MHIIIVYDVSVKRVTKVNKYLKQYLNWIQNSVFEGEITGSQYRKISETLKKMTDKNYDTIIIYKINDRKALERELIGIEKGTDNRFL